MRDFDSAPNLERTEITWIFGNGFDLRAGLNTSYGDFLEKRYRRCRCTERYRDKLLDICEEMSNQEAACDGQSGPGSNWADLEALICRASYYYGKNEVDDFNGTFEEIQHLLVDYLSREMSRIPDRLPKECVSSFRSSLTRFWEAIDPRDGRIDLSREPRSLQWNLVTLNYTDTLDRFAEASADSDDGYANCRLVSGARYCDYVSSPLHLHGTIDRNGNPMHVVFGIASGDSLSNDEFSSDPAVTGRWVKKELLEQVFRTDTYGKLREFLGRSRIACAYGTSIASEDAVVGSTDALLWNTIARWLLNDRDRILVIFVHDNGYRLSELARRKEETMAGFLKGSRIEEDYWKQLRSQVVVHGDRGLFESIRLFPGF